MKAKLNQTMHQLGRDGRCCGRLPRTYKSKGYLYCSRCSFTYAFDGSPLGMFGSGLDGAGYDARIRTASAASIARHLDFVAGRRTIDGHLI